MVSVDVKSHVSCVLLNRLEITMTGPVARLCHGQLSSEARKVIRASLGRIPTGEDTENGRNCVFNRLIVVCVRSRQTDCRLFLMVQLMDFGC